MSLWPTPDDGPRLEPVQPADLDAMVALRIRAMRPSLEALGRFDLERARQRLVESFAPPFMRHIDIGAQRVGFMTLQPDAVLGSLDLVHLYIEPSHQGQGLGAWALDIARSRADLLQMPLTLGALKDSPANAFYLRHGFTVTERREWDVQYRREPHADPLAVVRAVWVHFQARDWVAARALMHDGLQARWWASAERMNTANAYVRVQSEYPEGWTVHVMRLEPLDDGRVLAFVRVEHPPIGTFLVQQRTRVRDGRVAEVDELWATCEAPPAWRTPERIPGLERLG